MGVWIIVVGSPSGVVLFSPLPAAPRGWHCRRQCRVRGPPIVIPVQAGIQKNPLSPPRERVVGRSPGRVRGPPIVIPVQAGIQKIPLSPPR
ncbi:MAG: hypothetical protein NZ602_08965, partial [Thermoguttaceae bacterium]|nr:hypothetical protein [Thermoguttaceae bacterium]MDW8037600.1 hypothetical protein [Thermoguttaceae bacterium]